MAVDRKHVVTALLGFSSGLPLALTADTLRYWLTTENVTLETVGWFALVAQPYTFKPLWAPLFDRVDPPLALARLGRRRGWLLLVQLCLVAATAALGFTSPRNGIEITALAATCLAFFSASQDILVDAVRIETLGPEGQGTGAALNTWGYRIAMFCTGYGALELAGQDVPFRVIYPCAAVLVCVGIFATLIVEEPVHAPRTPPASNAIEAIFRAIIEPLVSLCRGRPWVRMLAFAILLKLGDALAAVMSSPFLVSLGFTASEIARGTKIASPIAALLGAVTGAFLLRRISIVRALPLASFIVLASNFAYCFLAFAGHSFPALLLATGVESFTSGVAGTVAIAFLSGLCHEGKAATQYAALTALTSFARTTLAGWSGVIVTFFAGTSVVRAVSADAWASYFAFTAVAGLPGLALAFSLRDARLTQTATT
jgi:MFS transporter, PAT family, beta-lactamase induction signal transducer AmpG